MTKVPLAGARLRHDPYRYQAPLAAAATAQRTRTATRRRRDTAEVSVGR